ncbi:hypothetical protein NC652_037621 [Populus alba x Populus x berolinensis]|nr:hypothetical protein NC652_037621 [Populus alba x Populus x berolinensis]
MHGIRLVPAKTLFPVSVVSYQVGKPSTEDRSFFFDSLIEAALSVVVEDVTKKSQGSAPLPELPEAQKVASGPKASELKAKIEAEQHALRRMRMCLRDVCNRLNQIEKLGTVTRTSARLRNVQPDVNLDQSYEALKRQKKNAEATQAGYFTTTSRLGSNSFAHTM